MSAWMPEAFGIWSLPLLMISVTFFPVKGIRKQLCFPDFLLIDWWSQFDPVSPKDGRCCCYKNSLIPFPCLYVRLWLVCMGAEPGEGKWKAPLNNSFVLFPDVLWDCLCFVIIFCCWNNFFKTQVSTFDPEGNRTLKFFLNSYVSCSSVIWKLVTFIYGWNTVFTLVSCHCPSSLTLDVVFITEALLFHRCFFSYVCFLTKDYQ